MTTKTIPADLIRRTLSLVIAVYAIIWMAFAVFVFRVFGIESAIGLSLILVLPVVFAVRMRYRHRREQKRTYIHLAVLFMLVLGASGGLVWHWYNLGVDIWHAQRLEYVEFRQVVRRDPAFRNIQLFVSGRGFVCIRGTVSSKADLDHLRSLQQKFDCKWYDKVDEVVVSP